MINETMEKDVSLSFAAEDKDGCSSSSEDDYEYNDSCSSSSASYEESESSDMLYGVYTKNDQVIDEWIYDSGASFGGQWRFRRIKNYNERESGYRAWIYFEIQRVGAPTEQDLQDHGKDGGDIKPTAFITIKSHNLRIKNHSKRLGFYVLLDSGDWKCSGWDQAEWLPQQKPSNQIFCCLRFYQTHADETKCPDVFLTLPLFDKVASKFDVWSQEGLRATFVPAWNLQTQDTYFPSKLIELWSEHEIVLRQIGLPADVLPRIQENFMNLCGNKAKIQELKDLPEFRDFFNE